LLNTTVRVIMDWGYQPLGLVKEELADQLAVMRAEAEAAGRDPAQLEVTLGHFLGRITQQRAASLAALGATRILLTPTAATDLAEVKDELSACAERLGLDA